MSGLLPVAASTSLVDEVHDRLRGWILDAVPAAGDRLNVDALARELDVSPTPIREALARLESEGLVTRAARRGWSVAAPLTLAELRDVYQLRLLIEPWAVGEATRRDASDGVKRLRRELARCPEAPARGTFAGYRRILEHDVRFHGLILDLAASTAVKAAFERTHCHLHIFRLAYGRAMGAEALAEHREIVDSMAAGDARGAQGAMRRHLRSSLARVEAAIEAEG